MPMKWAFFAPFQLIISGINIRRCPSGGEARYILPTPPEGLHVESGFAAEDAGDMLAIFNVAYLGS